jgi:hypothetical protein
MYTIYYEDQLNFNLKGIFLAGPSPRNNNVISWRKEALKILEELNHQGMVFVPDFKSSEVEYDFTDLSKKAHEFIRGMNWTIKHLLS